MMHCGKKIGGSGLSTTQILSLSILSYKHKSLRELRLWFLGLRAHTNGELFLVQLPLFLVKCRPHFLSWPSGLYLPMLYQQYNEANFSDDYFQ